MTDKFSIETLKLDLEKECKAITDFIVETVPMKLKRQGVVVALSGGIDSSTVAGLSVKALGKERVFGLLMPEKHSSEETLELSRSVAENFGIDYEYVNISPILDSLGCYEKQDEAYRKVIPEYTKDWKAKIVLPSVINSDSLRIFSVVAQSPDGKIVKKRLTPKAYLEIVAATNFKQRVRKMLEYYHADRLNFATTGTPNLQEYDQGFFVKLGDGAADIKPIAHLYKTQVYQMAAYVGVPENILKRLPTTDTYSMPQGQDEFYFSLPYDKMDLCLYGLNNSLGDEEVAGAAGITVEQLKRVYGDIEQKRRTTRYLHMAPQILKNLIPDFILEKLKNGNFNRR
ncbi:NAD(+) synthase [Spirochaeta isovalerica]|uniref:NH(3)-dependent NAD(+) synthetase n=1 Tax=Spirochaeta isovalerica TaxID=150 RepID=A0A841R2L0_9SPIO|nr:NAD(+) synthase [Spirochaeta isovalerica]MBB6479264.1 NAD+ synthase [Spirochaeta isovalerica]